MFMSSRARNRGIAACGSKIPGRSCERARARPAATVPLPVIFLAPEPSPTNSIRTDEGVMSKCPLGLMLLRKRAYGVTAGLAIQGHFS